MLRTIVVFLLLLWSLIVSLVSATAFDVSSQDRLQVETAVKQAITFHSSKLTQTNIQILIKRIDTMMMTARLTAKTAYLLDYLRSSLVSLSSIVHGSGSSSISPQQSSGSLIATGIAPIPISYQQGDKIILAGIESSVIAKYELTALYEDIMIKDFIISSSYNLDEVISSAQIYNASGIMIAKAYPTANHLDFNNQDILLKQGNHAWYMTVTPRQAGYNHAPVTPINYQLQFAITRALGMVSTEQVTMSMINQNNNYMTIRPFIFQQAGLSQSWNANTTDTLLNNGNTRAAILHLAIDSKDNTTSNNESLKVILSEISLSIGNNIAGSINSITLRNVFGGTTINGIISNGKVIFPLALMPSGERTLESLSEQGFLITVDATLSPQVSESLHFSMDTHSISFTTNEDSTISNDIGFGGGFTSMVSLRD